MSRPEPVEHPASGSEPATSPSGNALPKAKGGRNPDQIEDWLMAAGYGVLQRTPRSDGPIEEVKSKADEPPMVSRGRIRFCCPACQHTISMPRRVSGTKTRCPQCSSAVKAPDPKRNRGAYNYEQTIEAMLHPERFDLPDTSRPRLFGIPIPDAQTLLVAGAAALLVASIAQFFIAEQRQGMLSSTPQVAAAEAVPVAEGGDPAVLQHEAEDTVRKFLEAEGWERKAEYVRDAKRVAPMMQQYYSRVGGAPATKPETLRASPPGYYSNDQLPQQTSLVEATFPDGAMAKYRVEFLPDGPKVEWESSVAYSTKSWNEILRSGPSAPPELIRVAAYISNYWNDDFSDSKMYLSVGLQDPITKEPLGNAYIPYRTEDGARLRTFLTGSSGRRSEDVTLEIRSVANSSKTRQVEIVRFIKGGFRHVETPVMASSN
ncbi:MAG: hypothetical protein KA004_03360 [Verrucomicrobiales bacterium]|nr:hypothetical protein [Verrucomicrobiales bacterium]